VTVPAYPRLWSRHDVVNQHYRRYTRTSFLTVAQKSGWNVTRHTYFNSVLLAPAATVRLLQRSNAAGSDLDRTPGWLNRLLEVPLMLEAVALRAGLRLPAGLSFLAVLENPIAPTPRLAPVRRRPGRPSSNERVRTRVAASIALAALAAPVLTACSSVGGIQRASGAATSVPTIDHMASVASRRYGEEVYGAVVHQKIWRLAGDPVLRRRLASGNVTALRKYVQRQFWGVWYHWHVSRLRILRGSRVLVDTGVPFVVAPARATVSTAPGRQVTIEVSIQDVIGYVRFMHRHYPVDVVVRGNGPQHVKTSLPAALQVALPDTGNATVGGHTYRIRSFTKTAFRGERLKVWVLQRAPSL
jgi:hypothetical protein